MDFKMHDYTHAVVGMVMPALRCTDKADLNDARRQHDCYLRLLRELNLEVIEVDVEGSFPENIMLGDMAIVCHGIVLLSKPVSKVQTNMLAEIKRVMEGTLGHTVIEINDPEAKLQAADVLFTGREFFVGICETTNEAGAKAVAEAFPEYPCTPIKVSKGAKHFKNYITMAGHALLCVSGSRESQELLRRMEREASYDYHKLTVAEDDAANCLFVNGTLIHRAIEEIPDSFKVFCEKIDFARRSICFSELAKASSGLTACCLLVKI